jgi:hypothetical protein
MRLPLTPTFVRAVGTREPPPLRGRQIERTPKSERGRGLADALRRLVDRSVQPPAPVEDRAPAARRT